MIVKLPYGAEEIALDLRGLRVRALRPGAPAGHTDAHALVGAALDTPLAGPPLVELARNRRSATVIVPDATRKMGLPSVLPAVIERLLHGGIDGSAITVLVACGTPPESGDVGVQELVGPLPAGTKLMQHDCRNLGELVEVGELRPGIPLRLNRKAVETDLLITVGGVRHHYFAGFGGGPKMVFPGVGGYEEIQANHALVLRQTGGLATREPACEPGILAGNPVAEEIAKAVDLCPPDLAVCTVEGMNGEIAWAAAGPLQDSFGAAVENARLWFEVPGERSLDLIVACGGGSPTDSTLIQAHKAFDAACRFLREGGEILFVAALDGGTGSPEMEVFLTDPKPSSILALLQERWVQYGHTTLRLLEKTGKFRVHLYSNQPAELGRQLGFEPVENPEAVLDRWRRDHPRASVGVMAASAVYPRTQA